MKDFDWHTSTKRPSAYCPSIRVPENNSAQNNNKEKNSDPYPLIYETTHDQSEIQLELAGPHLVRAAEICVGETEVQSNIIRTLSVLSEQDNCCEMLTDLSARLGILLGPCPATNVNSRNVLGGPMGAKPLGMLSRTGYILGNIMAKSDAARIQVSFFWSLSKDAGKNFSIL